MKTTHLLLAALVVCAGCGEGQPKPANGKGEGQPEPAKGKLALTPADTIEIQEAAFMYLIKASGTRKRLTLQVETTREGREVYYGDVPPDLLTRLQAKHPRVETGIKTTLKDGTLVTSDRGEEIYELSIGQIERFSDHVEIEVSGFGGVLNGGGATLALKSNGGRWTITDEHSGWVSYRKLPGPPGRLGMLHRKLPGPFR